MREKLRIGITCYSTYGGSGVIATEIGMAMASRGHRVHFICADMPMRLNRFTPNVYYHEVEVHEYPLFSHPHYDLALASKMVEVATYEKLDLLHVHYAVPHATSAYMAKQILQAENPQIVPRVITTLHGTDITLVGNERGYLPITRFSIMQSDGVTAPSLFLKHATYDKLNIPTTCPIEVIPNFVDSEKFIPISQNGENAVHICFGQEKPLPVLVHVSNFRPVKRTEDVVRVFAKTRESIPCHLVLIGDGPDRSRCEELVRELGLEHQVCFFGKHNAIVDVLQASSIFLLPSKNESFGLAALEAMSCGLPVVASRAEGIPEAVVHGETGFLSEVADIDSMAKDCVRLLSDPDLYARMSRAARKHANESFSRDPIVERYERYYYQILDGPKL
ncbi:MAG: N-acetyl-alpha-D-glucosaminyl L-malate synthase BshA [Bdellovibrionales bacterium]|nr:N-acetyl-alpha-D-glucosaminyl L-malate synthase BshA [Bdellovibrionales bacterium]